MHRSSAEKLAVLGVGAVTGCGRGIDRLTGDRATDAGLEEESGARVSRVAPETLQDRTVLKGMRRADRFSKMAVLAAHDACTEARLDLSDNRAALAVIVATAFGPHRTTFGFLDEILDFGDTQVSPTLFSHSVHNAAASYVATALQCRGPACTLTDFDIPLHLGLRTAALWLRSGRCQSALVGYVEEVSAPLAYAAAVQAARGGPAAPQPFNLSPCPEAMASEGSLFLALGLDDGAGRTIDPDAFAGERAIRDVISLLRHLEEG